ncbi:MAG: hypothetical protein GQ578_05855 [Desulfuromonadaceae bacterium]|nr:hypothetical protein [Desulfuromonadaceae bacterium]
MMGKIQKLVAAIGKLDPNDPAHFTADDKPSANVLKELLGEQVSAAERDEAWQIYQLQNAAPAKATAPVDLTGANAVVTMIGGKAQQVWYRGGQRIHIGPDPKAE